MGFPNIFRSQAARDGRTHVVQCLGIVPSNQEDGIDGSAFHSGMHGHPIEFNLRRITPREELRGAEVDPILFEDVSTMNRERQCMNNSV